MFIQERKSNQVASHMPVILEICPYRPWMRLSMTRYFSKKGNQNNHLRRRNLEELNFPNYVRREF